MGQLGLMSDGETETQEPSGHKTISQSLSGYMMAWSVLDLLCECSEFSLFKDFFLLLYTYGLRYLLMFLESKLSQRG